MIGKLRGTLTDLAIDGSAVVEVGGVGYCVRVPLSHKLHEGDAVSLYIHTAVRDDAIDLYGFAHEDELRFFRELMSVSGVGPKTALSIMGAAEPMALKRTIAAGDSGALHKVFGIGKKSAERIVVELRDKMALQTGTGAHHIEGSDGEVIEALMALGYRADESRRALQTIGADGKGSVKERLGAALKALGSRAAA